MKLTLCTQLRKIITVPLSILSSVFLFVWTNVTFIVPAQLWHNVGMFFVMLPSDTYTGAQYLVSESCTNEYQIWTQSAECWYLQPCMFKTRMPGRLEISMPSFVDLLIYGMKYHALQYNVFFSFTLYSCLKQCIIFYIVLQYSHFI